MKTYGDNDIHYESYDYNLQDVQYLIEQQNIDIYIKEINNKTLLHNDCCIQR